MRERFVEAAGVRLLAREAGEGPPVLLLHGFPQTGECWRAVATSLARTHRVVVPDLPGFGASAPPPSFDAATVARVIGAMMDETGIPRAAVVGHDWGGSIAFRLALDAPERVERLCVANAPFRRLDLRRGYHFLLLNIPVLPEIAFALAGRSIVSFMLRAGSADGASFPPEALRAYREAFSSAAKARGALAYYRTITRSALARRLPRRGPGERRARRRIEAPTLIVWGTRDPVLPESLLEGIVGDIPGAEVLRLDCGHFVPEEAPVALAEALERFLR